MSNKSKNETWLALSSAVIGSSITAFFFAHLFKSKQKDPTPFDEPGLEANVKEILSVMKQNGALQATSEAVDELRKEVTGSNSVPIITAKVKFNYFDSNVAKWTPPGFEGLRNQWIISFTIHNQGNYTIPLISVFRSIKAYRQNKEEAFTKAIQLLLPGGRQFVDPPFALNMMPTQTETYEFTLGWKTSYKYTVTVEPQQPDMNPTITKDKYGIKEEFYTFKEVKYNNSEELRLATLESMAD